MSGTSSAYLPADRELVLVRTSVQVSMNYLREHLLRTACAKVAKDGISRYINEARGHICSLSRVVPR